MSVQSTYRCPWCDVEKNLRGLACHAGKVHKTSAEELHRQVLHGGSTPLCKCGCGSEVKWLQKHFGEYLRGHNGFSTVAHAKAVEVRRAKAIAGELSSWNKGLTKETDDRVARSAERISGAANSAAVVERCKVKLEERKSKRRSAAPAPVVEKSQAQIKILPPAASSFDRAKESSRRDETAKRELYEFVRSLRPDAELSKRDLPGVSEVDVYVPSRSLALEYNGLFWHSDAAGKRPSYHQDKTDACAAAGVQLMHVYEDDWKYHGDAIRSMIKHRLGISATRVYARDCELVTLDKTERRDFFERCHMDGDTMSAVAFGLKRAGRLVAAISLRRPFHKKWSSFAEVARFATERDHSVPGGLSKLVKAACAWAERNGFQGLMSYVDGRIGEGNGYVTAGFEKVGSSPPSFWWTDFDRRFNRFKYRADKAAGLTEQQVAMAAGVVRIYGCKNSIFVKRFSPIVV